jgi:hypothetical protein
MDDHASSKQPGCSVLEKREANGIRSADQAILRCAQGNQKSVTKHVNSEIVLTAGSSYDHPHQKVIYTCDTLVGDRTDNVRPPTREGDDAHGRLKNAP